MRQFPVGMASQACPLGNSHDDGERTEIREFAVEPPDQLVANFSQELPILGG
jgi:hypothetical protein